MTTCIILLQQRNPENVPLNDLDIDEDLEYLDIEEEHETNGKQLKELMKFNLGSFALC